MLRAGAEPIAQLKSGETAAMLPKNKPLARMLYRAEAKALERLHQTLEANKKLAAAEEVDGDEGMYEDHDGEEGESEDPLLDAEEEEEEEEDEDDDDEHHDEPKHSEL